MRGIALALFLALPVCAAAQGEIEVIPLEPAPQQDQEQQGNGLDTGPGLESAPRETREQVSTGTGAVLRALDKLNAKVSDVTLSNGGNTTSGRIDIELSECRYPTNDPSGNAYAYLTVREAGVAEPVFRGWMIAASPALNPMDHPRYDVWVLRCTTS